MKYLSFEEWEARYRAIFANSIPEVSLSLLIECPIEPIFRVYQNIYHHPAFSSWEGIWQDAVAWAACPPLPPPPTTHPPLK